MASADSAHEVILPIHHLLMAPRGTGKIKVALSHPQALAQRQDYLKKHKIQAEAFYDTAGAAEELAKAPRPHTAAIASEAGLNLSKIESHPTRKAAWEYSFFLYQSNV